MGTGLELDVITAVVLGGTASSAARGTIVGTVLGLVLMQALKNGLALAGVKGDGTIVVIGAVLILSILISNLFRTGRRRLTTGTKIRAAAAAMHESGAKRNGARHDTTSLLAAWRSTAMAGTRHAARPGPAATTCRPTRWPATARRRAAVGQAL